jgi:hypothetical protein
MNVSEPEADIEYSRASAASRARERALGGGPGAIGVAVLGGALLGAVLLLVAEFLPLFEVRTTAHNSVATTVIAGSHHSWALIPIAALAAVLAVAWWRSASRLPLIALGVLAIVTLVIALGRDLPDAQSSGLERSGGTFVLAAASPRIALYLETAGGVILLLSAGAGLMLGPRPNPQLQTI